jgi:hypothetical protein
VEYSLSQLLKIKNLSPKMKLWIQIAIFLGFVAALFLLILTVSMRKMRHIREGSVIPEGAWDGWEAEDEFSSPEIKKTRDILRRHTMGLKDNSLNSLTESLNLFERNMDTEDLVM